MRHPHAICDADVRQCRKAICIVVRGLFGKQSTSNMIGRKKSNYVLDKDYMLPMFKSEYVSKLNASTTTSQQRRQPRALFFDLGASTYRDGFGGPSLSWFIDTYKKRGFTFDRVIGWEAEVLEPKKIFEGMPDDLMTSISYFNIPVEDTKGGKNNPWRYIRALARPTDFVVVKLDIDTPQVEIELIRQLIMDDDLTAVEKANERGTGTGTSGSSSRLRLSNLIDELYFEHHVWGSALTPIWESKNALVADGDLAGSYRMFAALRHLGIRAHSWV